MNDFTDYDYDSLMASLAAAESALNLLPPEDARWSKVRRIALSPRRLSSLRAGAEPSALPSPWASMVIESSPMCDDSFAVLVSGAGVPLGIFSFETGLTRWFDEAAMSRTMAPNLNLETRNCDEFRFAFTSPFNSKYGLGAFRRPAQ